MMNYKRSVVLWACQCCTLVMANGECCEEHPGGPIYDFVEKLLGWDDPLPDSDRILASHDPKPLSTIPDGVFTTLGGAEHDSWCDRHEGDHDCAEAWFEDSDVCEQCQRERTLASKPDYECDCDRLEFSWSSCDACGSNLGGDRHAFIIWYPTESVA